MANDHCLSPSDVGKEEQPASLSERMEISLGRDCTQYTYEAHGQIYRSISARVWNSERAVPASEARELERYPPRRSRHKTQPLPRPDESMLTVDPRRKPIPVAPAIGYRRRRLPE